MKAPKSRTTTHLSALAAAILSAATLLPKTAWGDGLYKITPSSHAEGESPGATQKDALQRGREVATAKAIEVLRAQIEEWGSVNVSEFLIYPVDDQFKLDKDENFPTAKDYITAERTNISAAVSQLSEKIFTARGAANVKLTPPVLPNGGAASGGGGAAPASGGDTPAAEPTLPEFTADQYLSKKTFEPLGGLFATGNTMTIPERQAVLLGTGDKITELLARKLANPPKPADGKKLYLAMFQITCNPGWRTLQGYMADVFINMEFAKLQNGKVLNLSLDEDNTQCSIVSVLPLVDAQNMELRNGQREMTGLLAALSATGAIPQGSAAGKGVAEYINRFQKDAASRHAMPVVNSYATGKGMGFRFSPSFLAIGDPTKKKGRSVNQLIPTSFPVLAILSIDPAEVRGPGGKDGDASYNALATRVSNRWLLRDRRISLVPWDFHLPMRRDTELRRLDRTTAAKAAYDAAGKSAPGGTYDDLTFQMQRTDLVELEHKLLGKWVTTPLPEGLFETAPKAPEVAEVDPKLINPEYDNVLVIRGSNFSGDGLRVFCGGRECEGVSAPGSDVVIAVIKAGKFSTTDVTSGGKSATVKVEMPEPIIGDRVPKLPKPSGGAAGAPGAMRKAEVIVVTKVGRGLGSILLPPKRDEPKPTPDGTERSIVLKRDAQGRIIGMDFNETATLKGDKLIEAIGHILAPAEGAPRVIIEKPQP